MYMKCYSKYNNTGKARLLLLMKTEESFISIFLLILLNSNKKASVKNIKKYMFNIRIDRYLKLELYLLVACP